MIERSMEEKMERTKEGRNGQVYISVVLAVTRMVVRCGDIGKGVEGVSP